MTTTSNVRDLSPEQRAALARLRARKAGGIVRVPRDGRPLPCSFEQRRMWLSAQVDPDHVANVTAGISLHGPLDAEALRAAVAALVARHEVLRTVLVDVDGEPYQQILPELDAPLTVVDLAGADGGAEEREERAAALARRAAGERFDLARAPLFRAHLYRLTAGEHRLMLVWHHVISDGWSVDNTISELATAYRDIVAGGVPDRPELPIQYADYAAWSRSRLGGDELAERLSYWRDQLAEPPTILHSGSPAPGATGSGEVVITIPAELVFAVQRAGSARTTPYMAFLTAYQALLARLTGDRSVAVGTVTGGRGRTELEPLIGCFINLLPLRTGLDPTLPFRDAAARVRSALATAMANEVPFDELTSALATARSDRMAALFQSAVIWQQAHAERQDWPADLATERWGRPVDEAAFDLALIVRELPDGCELCFHYRADRFAAPVVEQLASLFHRLLESIAAAPDVPLADHDLLTDADRERLARCNATGTVDPAWPLLHQATGPAREQHGAGERELGYWREQLAGVPALALPTDRPYPPARTEAGAAHAIRLDATLTASITRLARACAGTPFMVLMAAYQAVLGWWCRQDDFGVGVPVAPPETEGTVGLPANVLAIRADLSGDPTFDALLDRVRTTAMAAYAHQEAPFEEVVAALEGTHDVRRSPVFQAGLAVQDVAGTRDRALGAAPFPVEHGATRHELALDVHHDGDELAGTLTYNADLFDADTVERLAERFVALLRQVVVDPTTRLSGLEMTTASERARLARWSVGPALTTTDPPAPVGPAARTVIDLVAARARATPDLVAVIADDRRLRYGDLMARASAVAHRLAEAAVVRGDLVAVCLDRSADVPSVLLGVALAGAAYVPIDPDYPAARIEYLLADSGAVLVVGNGEFRDRLPVDARVLDVDAPGFFSAAQVERPLDPPGPEDPAYVLYTSGSTGRPKGVVVPHRALADFLAAMAGLVGARPDARWLGMTSLSFDISALELFLPLVGGGSVVIAGRDAAWDGAALARLVRDNEISHVQATPSGWRMLLDEGLDPAGLVALVGGEPLPVALAGELRTRAARVLNMYGPTETTIWSTAWEVPADPLTVAIGRPIAGTSVHVLDPTGRLVAPGAVGELCIGGAGVTHGYHGRPRLTAERFVPDPFGAPGGRLYRTGDLVRWRPDGLLQFLGRDDHQLKLRGHRIEPSEIEAVLEAHPAVRQAVVVVRDERLVAYLVPSDGTGTTPDGLVDHAAATLPGALVPAAWVALAALPLTPNGKVDRGALPDPAPAPRAAHVAPRTTAEELVASVWREVLELDDVSVDDDFFAIGGHSLLAMRVMARLRAAIEIELPVRTLFAHSTVAELAAAVQDRLVAEFAQLSDEDAERLLAEEGIDR